MEKRACDRKWYQKIESTPSRSVWEVPENGTVGLDEYLNTQVLKINATAEALVSSIFKGLKFHQVVHLQPSLVCLELPRTHNFFH